MTSTSFSYLIVNFSFQNPFSLKKVTHAIRFPFYKMCARPSKKWADILVQSCMPDQGPVPGCHESACYTVYVFLHVCSFTCILQRAFFFKKQSITVFQSGSTIYFLSSPHHSISCVFINAFLCLAVLVGVQVDSYLSISRMTDYVEYFRYHFILFT